MTQNVTQAGLCADVINENISDIFWNAFHLLSLHSAKVIKHKISFLLQKPEPQAADQKQTNEESAAAERSE